MSLEPQAGISSYFLLEDRGILPLGRAGFHFHLFRVTEVVMQSSCEAASIL